jgi:nicotinamide mononucleotide adenylyltransferase
VRRTREYLETAIDEQTNEPYLKPVVVRLFGEAENEAVTLPATLQDAYADAEEFCQILAKRPNMNAAFLRNVLLRRVGSTIFAGQRTATKMLRGDVDDEEEEDTSPPSALAPLSDEERTVLERFLARLEPLVEADPKLREVLRILLEGANGTQRWLDEGCIIFSQYYDSAYWVAERLSRRLPDWTVGLYAGTSKSGVFREGQFTRLDREAIKQGVRNDELKLVVGTDAASEGLNLQRLGTLINLDLPWNPTRLEQRKGRIQRIGQVRDEVFVYNLRYRGSVEDRVHQMLSHRLASIRDLFGQLPDTLEDVWVAVAEHDVEKAKQVIDEVPEAHPFSVKYDRIEPVDWESCAQVLDTQPQLELLRSGWRP